MSSLLTKLSVLKDMNWILFIIASPKVRYSQDRLHGPVICAVTQGPEFGSMLCGTMLTFRYFLTGGVPRFHFATRPENYVSCPWGSRHSVLHVKIKDKNSLKDWLLALLLAIYVTLTKLFNLPKPQSLTPKVGLIIITIVIMKIEFVTPG